MADKTTDTTISQQTHYAPEIRATCRALYESGTFQTIDTLHEHCKKIFSRPPSLSSMRHWAAEEKWDKNRSTEDIAEEQRIGFVKIFAKLGMGETERAEAVVDGIRAGESLIDECKTAISKIETSEELVNLLQRESTRAFAGYELRRKYLDQAHKLCGDYAPEKRAVTADVKDRTRRERVREMNLDEIRLEIARMSTISND